MSMSCIARLLARLIRERDELLAATALDERNPLPPLPGPDGDGALCQSRAAALWGEWQPLDGTLSARERLRQEVLAELAARAPSLYAVVAPCIVEALDAHTALADALNDDRPPDLERHSRALDAVRVHLPAIGAALGTQAAPAPARTSSTTRASTPTYSECVKQCILDALADGKPRKGLTIASLTGKTYDYVRKVLPKMIADGLLTHSHTDGYRRSV
jgi:hypothetical protein